MLPSDVDRFRMMLFGMSRIYGTELDAIVLDVYWLALRDWDIEEFKDACGQLMKTSKFMPRPSDFHALRKASALTAGEAFHKAMEIARNCSPHRAESSGDHTIDAAARACGGYYAMGMTETDKLHFLERRFNEHFESISDATEIRGALPNLSDPKRLS